MLVIPRIQTASDGMTAWECTNALVQNAAIDLGGTLQETVDGIVEMPLDHVLPAALTPQMHVTTRAHVRPPLLSFLTGNRGITLTAEATSKKSVPGQGGGPPQSNRNKLRSIVCLSFVRFILLQILR
jgi:hypothetical protein